MLGDDVASQSATATQAVASPGAMAVTAAFAVAVLGTAMPWTRFQEGSGPFGAWGLSPRWSMLAALASVCGLVVSIVAWRELKPAVITAMRIAAIVVVVGTILAIARPPAFAPPWLGPWVTLAGGVAATALGYTVVRPTAPPERSAEPGHARSA
jgi:O-antigen/teichoic acid export membrane protein